METWSNLFRICTAICLFVLFNAPTLGFGQVQQKKWYIRNVEVDFTVSTPAASSGLPGWATQSTDHGVYNGFCDAEGNLQFYINISEVRNKNGGLIGELNNASFPLMPEMNIVPVPEEPCHFYVIYTPVIHELGCGTNMHPIYWSELDLTLNGGDGGFASNGNILDDCSFNAWSNIAVGKLRAGNIRYLYRLGTSSLGTELQRYTISSAGISGPTSLETFSFTYDPIEEMELSHDQTMLAFAGGGNNDVIILHLDGSGDFDDTGGDNGDGTSFFSVSASGNQMTGIEFSPNGNYLYVGQKDIGIFQLNIGTGGSSKLTNSDDYGNSQLELAYHPTASYKIYATDGDYLGEISNPNTSGASFTIEVVSGINTGYNEISSAYVLPEQIDGQDYDDFSTGLTTVCCLAYEDYDVTTYRAVTSGTWTSSNNPLNGGSGSIAFIRDEIRIPANISVTIQEMELYFAPEGRIVIENGTGSDNLGGKLTVNESVLTADPSCDPENGMWRGIEVWGNSSQNQFPSSNPDYQGILILNESTIEHAREAVSLYNPLVGFGSTGGIVKSNGSTFLNCRRSAAFLKYQNWIPTTGAFLGNFSSFSNTSFIVNDNYIGANGQKDFYVHVTMWAVNGVVFNACTFTNEQSNQAYNLKGNKGIYSIDAGYQVRSTCDILIPCCDPCPDIYLNRTSFSGFNFGVHAVGGGTDYTVNIDLAEFTDNAVGVQMEKVDNFAVTRSNFNIGGNGASGIPFSIHYGVVSISSTGYRIEENFMEQTMGDNEYSVGVKVLNSGQYDNEIYKNETKDVTIGEWAEGLNRKDQNSPWHGLRIICNEHDNDSKFHHDISVSNYGNPLDGIANWQSGSKGIYQSAANLFSQGSTNSYSDYFNNNLQLIRYNHHGGQSEPLSYGQNIYPELVANNNTCPSNFEGGLIYRLSTNMRDSLSQVYSDAEVANGDVMMRYDELIDGGNTAGLIEYIQGAGMVSQELMDTLNEYSPFVSYDVLKGAIGTDSLTAEMILQLCLSNPDAITGYEFIEFVQDSIGVTVPETYIDSIIRGLDSVTERTNIIDSLSYYSGEMSFISNLLIADIKLDSIVDTTSLRNWLRERRTLNDLYSLCESYMIEGDFNKANDVLDSISILAQLSEITEEEYTDYIEYFNFRWDIDTSGSTISELDSSEVEELKSIAYGSVGRASVMSYNILCYFYDTCQDYSTSLPAIEEVGKRGAFPLREAEFKEDAGVIKVFPNPSNTQATIKWNFPGEDEGGNLLISDLSGRVIQKIRLVGNTGQWRWSLSHLPGGIYIYTVHSDSGQIWTGKVLLE